MDQAIHNKADILAVQKEFVCLLDDILKGAP